MSLLSVSFIYKFWLRLSDDPGSWCHLFLTSAAQSIIVKRRSKGYQAITAHVPVFLFHSCRFTCSHSPELNIDAPLKVFHIRHALV